MFVKNLTYKAFFHLLCHLILKTSTAGPQITSLHSRSFHYNVVEIFRDLALVYISYPMVNLISLCVILLKEADLIVFLILQMRNIRQKGDEQLARCSCEPY